MLGRAGAVLVVLAACGRSGDPPARERDAESPVTRAPADAAAAPPARPRAVAVELAAGTVIALLDDGTVRAWGRGKHGGLGTGAGPDVSTPQRVPGITDAVELVADGGSWTPVACVRDRAGRWTCWGEGEYLPGTAIGPIAPTVIPELDQASAVRFGAWFGCAIRGDRTVICWGQPPVHPEYHRDARQPAAPVAGLDDIIDLEVTSKRACALRGDGRVLCWGEDDQGQTSAALGPPVTGRWVATPTPVPDVAGAVEIGLGYTVSCARRDDDVLACWGETFSGMGVVGVDGYEDGHFFDAGELDLCERTPLGAIRCMPSRAQGDCLVYGMSLAGDCPGGRLADCPEAIRAIERCARGEMGHDPGKVAWKVLDPSPVRDRAKDLHTTCVVTDAGEVACWGKNDHGQLGVGTLIDHDDPATVPALVETVPPPAAPPIPPIDPSAIAPAWDQRPADCAMDATIAIEHPMFGGGALPVRAAWAEASEYGTDIVLVDHLVASHDMSSPDLRADQRAIKLSLVVQARGGAELRPVTAGRYPLRRYDPKRAGRLVEGSLRSAEHYLDFLEEEAPLRGEVTITRHDGRWVCGAIDLRGKGARIEGRFAAEVTDFTVRF